MIQTHDFCSPRWWWKSPNVVLRIYQPLSVYSKIDIAIYHHLPFFGAFLSHGGTSKSSISGDFPWKPWQLWGYPPCYIHHFNGIFHENHPAMGIPLWNEPLHGMESPRSVVVPEASRSPGHRLSDGSEAAKKSSPWTFGNAWDMVGIWEVCKWGYMIGHDMTW